MSIERLEFGDFFFSFMQAYNKLDRLMCQLTNLYSGQPRILTMLMTKEGIPLKELSSMTNLGMPSLSVSIKNLEKTGHVYREKGTTGDNRTSLIFLTEEGRTHALEFHHLIHNYFEEVLKAFEPQDAAYITDIMRRLYETTTNYYEHLKD